MWKRAKSNIVFLLIFAKEPSPSLMSRKTGGTGQGRARAEGEGPAKRRATPGDGDFERAFAPEREELPLQAARGKCSAAVADARPAGRMRK
jgi:hypothetical protein